MTSTELRSKFNKLTNEELGCFGYFFLVEIAAHLAEQTELLKKINEKLDRNS